MKASLRTALDLCVQARSASSRLVWIWTTRSSVVGLAHGWYQMIAVVGQCLTHVRSIAVVGLVCLGLGQMIVVVGLPDLDYKHDRRCWFGLLWTALYDRRCWFGLIWTLVVGLVCFVWKALLVWA
ncbi:hypothetical protein HAX54_027382 [Datura stramonium]|uniref:Uncharacterized protein n=1 Tax=Datura stramonium TaxID=4076 RepID=A0ABS8S8Q6_DATST|nr:hypothetical protein [Datura stramonium]